MRYSTLTRGRRTSRLVYWYRLLIFVLYATNQWLFACLKNLDFLFSDFIMEQDAKRNHIPDQWGYCLPGAEELVPRENQKYSTINKCTDNYHHTCSAQANYGGMVVDWDARTIELSLFTPHESEKLASAMVVQF